MPYARSNQTCPAKRPYRKRRIISDDGEAIDERAIHRGAPQPGEALQDWIPRASPYLSSPQHLHRFMGVLETLPHSNRRVTCSIPCQHGKSISVEHAIAYWLAKEPTLKVILASYSYARSQQQSRNIRALATQAGCVFRPDSNSVAQWQLVQGGGLLSSSVGGIATGFSADVVVIDDAVKNLEEAQSATNRESIYDWFRSCLITRLARDSAVCVIGSRWHLDDLPGRLIKEGYEDVTLPAISDDGEALWPDVRPIEFLEQQRKAMGERLFSSLFQGCPLSTDGAVFGPPTYYTETPTSFQVVIGCDLAYSENSRADYSVAVILGLSAGVYYVLDVFRHQGSLDQTESRLRFFASLYPAADIVSYIGATEKGAIALLMNRGLSIFGMPAQYSKYVRAQNTAAAWNVGKIQVPQSAVWVAPFVKEVCAFEGSPNDTHDDQVDALVSGYDWLCAGDASDIGSFTMGSRTM